MDFRKPSLWFSLLWVVLSAGAQNTLLLPVKTDGHWGYCDTSGALRIPLQFESAGMFLPDGLAPVKQNGSVYLINRAGEIITKDHCQNIQVINSGIYACYNGNEWKFHGPGLNTPAPAAVKALEFIFGKWIFFTPTGAGIFNERLQVLVEPIYDQITASQEPGFFYIYKDSLTGICDNQGNVLLPPSYRQIRFKQPGILLFQSADKLGVVSLNGKIRTDTVYNDVQTSGTDPFILLFDDSSSTAQHLHTGKTWVCDSLTRLAFWDPDYLMAFVPGGLNLLDSNLQYVFAQPYESIQRQADGFIVRKNGLYGFCNLTGKEIHPTRYTYISNFVGGTSITGFNGLWGAIHSSGTALAEPVYTKAEIFSETAKMYSNGSVTTVTFDSTGRVIDRVVYKNFKTITIGGFRDARRPTQTSDASPPSAWFFDPIKRKWGLNSAQGELLLAPQFDVVNRHDDNLTRVGIRRAGTVYIDQLELQYTTVWGLVHNKTGQLLIKPEYIDIRKDTGRFANKHHWVLVSPNLHFFIHDTTDKRSYGPFTWVGKPGPNGRPVAESGKWKFYLPDTTLTHKGTLTEFLTNYFSPGLFFSKAFGNASGELVLEGGLHYRWPAPQRKPGDPDYSYRYLSEFTDRYAIMSPRGSQQFGVVDCDGRQILSPEYDRIEIIHANNKVFFLKYNKRQTFGFIKETGDWAFEQKFAKEGHFSEGMAFMGRDEKKGMACADSNGRVTYLQHVIRANAFSEGLASIRDKRRWYFVDKSLSTVLENKAWNWAGQFYGGLAPVRIKNEYHYINTQGQPANKQVYQVAQNYNEHGALVCKKGHWGLIDAEGKYIIKPKYRQAKYNAKDTLYLMAGNKGWYLYRPDGNKLLKQPIQHYRSFVDGHGMVTLNNGTPILLKKNGSFLKAPKHSRLQSVQGDFATVFPESTGKIQLTNDALEHLYITPQDEYIRFKYGSEGLVFAKVRRKGWVAINREGVVEFSLTGTPVSGFSEGFAIVCLPDGKYIYINREGEQAFGLFFRTAQPFADGKAYISQDKGLGVIDRAGNFIISPKYKYIGRFYEGFAAVRMESLIRISDTRDRPLVDGQYDSVTLDPCGYFRVESADRVGWIAQDGRIVWNPAR